jgi:hypothetical protein
MSYSRISGAAGVRGAAPEGRQPKQSAGGCWTLNDLAETSEVGDWMMPDYKMACTYAASQGWLIVQDDALTLTTAGSAAA